MGWIIRKYFISTGTVLGAKCCISVELAWLVSLMRGILLSLFPVAIYHYRKNSYTTAVSIPMLAYDN